MSGLRQRNYTFSLTVDDTPNLSHIFTVVQQYPKFAYILHDNDINDDSTPKKSHYHFYIEFPNPRYLNSIANDLNISPNFIEKIYDKSSILRYLTHENNEDKYQYSKSDIITNMDFTLEIKASIDVLQEYDDFLKVKRGEMTPKAFLEKYKIHCAT